MYQKHGQLFYYMLEIYFNGLKNFKFKPFSIYFSSEIKRKLSTCIQENILEKSKTKEKELAKSW